MSFDVPGSRRGLMALAIFGLLVPNGLFLWIAATRWDLVLGALANPVALVFIGEAFLLMFLLGWFFRRLDPAAPSLPLFVVLSLVGSLAFSVPYTLHRLAKARQANGVDR